MATISCGRSRRHALLLATTVLISDISAFGALLCSGPALAQTAAYPLRDENGVDLVKGDWRLDFKEGAIGSGKAELPLIRRSAFGTNWDAVQLQRYQSGSNFLIYIYLDGEQNSFDSNASGSVITNREMRGAILVKTGNVSYTYKSPSGVEIDFYSPIGNQKSNFCNSILTTPSCILLPQVMRSPDKTNVTFAWATQNTTEPEPGNNPKIYRYALSSVSNSFGYSIQFAKDATTWQRTSASFLNSSVTPPLQGTVSYTYPINGTINVTDLAANVWQITGSSIKRPTEATPGFVVTNPSAVTAVTRDGVTTNYNRVVSGSTVTMTVTKPLSNTMTIVSNAIVGRPSTITNALNRTTSFTYDANARLTRTTSPEGNYVNYTLDGRSNVTETRRVAKSGSGLTDLVETASYPATCTNPVTCNRPDWTRDAKGNQTDYTYDPTHGGVLTVTLPAATAGGTRPQTRYTYTLLNGEYLLTGTSACSVGSSCANAATETKTTLVYDASRNLTSSTTAAGDSSIIATTAITYNGWSDVLTIDGPLAGTADTTRLRYDAARRAIGAVGPDPDGANSRLPLAVRTSYNASGLVTQTEVGNVTDQSDPAWAAFSSAQQSVTTYDATSRPVKTELKSGGSTFALSQVGYDAVGRIDCSVTRMDPAQWAGQTNACLAQTTGPYGPDRVTKTTYDAASQVTKTETGLGTTEVTSVSSTYSLNGKQATVADGLGNLTTYEYDGFDRLAKTRYPIAGSGTVSSTTDYEGLTYDANSNVTQRRLRDGQTIAYTYDNLDRVTLKDVPNSVYYENDIQYSYDLLGRMTLASNGVGRNATLGYDALGRLTSETSFLGTKTMQYDLAGRMTRLTHHDGMYFDYDYRVTGEVSAIRENGAISGIGVLATYTYDDLGRRTVLYRGNATQTDYTYDPVSRLGTLTNNLGATAHDVTTTFSYNPASQIASSTRDNDAYAWNGHYNVDRPYAVNGLNQLTTAGATALGYDGRGNLTSSGSTNYGYTSENMLATQNSIPALAYEALGRLSQSLTASGTATEFDYVGSAMIIEKNTTAGPILRRYVYGPGTDEPLVWYEGSGTTDRRWLYTDERGSVTAVASASGNAIALNSYDEYGIPAATNTGRFQYTGQTWLPELGMYYYKARMYSPTLGRFMQTDPIGYSDGINWYAYVGGDPVNLVDPSGLERQCAPSNGDGTRICWDDDITVTGTRQFRPVLKTLPPLPASPPRLPNIPTFPRVNEPNGSQNGDDGAEIIVTAVHEPDSTNLPLLLNIGGGEIDSGLPRDEASLQKLEEEAKKAGDKQKLLKIRKQQKVLGYSNRKDRQFQRLNRGWWPLFLLDSQTKMLLCQQGNIDACTT